MTQTSSTSHRDVAPAMDTGHQCSTGCEDNTNMNMGSRDQHLNIGNLLKIATWNCGGLSYTQRQLCQELDYDILALSETHDKGTLNVNRNYISSDPVPNDDSFSGVALLLSDRVAKCVTHSGCYGSRIVYAKIRAKPCDLFIVNVYMPHASRKVKPFASDTLKHLEAVLSQASRHDCIVLLGDLNCKLGRFNKKLTGRWCIHKHANKEGKLMLDLMQRMNITAVSTFFQPKRGKSNATYLAKDPRYKPSQIDYVLVSSRWATAVRDCKVKWGVACQRWGRHYDHGLVSCFLRSRVKASKKPNKRLDFGTLKTDVNLRSLLEQEVHANLNMQPFNSNSSSESLANLQRSVLAAAESVLPTLKSVPLRKRHVSERTRCLYMSR